MVVKLDISKAYDKVRWEFLLNFLSMLGFNDAFINIIKNCIKDCWFSIFVNGKANSFFSIYKGLRK